jgi:Fis family transcriptional regulator
MRKYFKELDGEAAKDIYSMVLKEVELPLLQIVMKQCNDNQTEASHMLGINRGTLRTKLKEYKLL